MNRLYWKGGSKDEAYNKQALLRAAGRGVSVRYNHAVKLWEVWIIQ